MAVCLFDLDGVLTETASVHAKAWKATFDAYLEKRSRASGEPFTPFDIAHDYQVYVDGKPRYDGVRAFLEARRIQLPEGTPGDSPQAETVYGIGNLKNEAVQRLLQEEGVDPYPGSVRYLEAVRGAGLALAVVSSSANCRQVLRVAGIEHFFRVIVDGVVIADRHLPGKPAPDTFLAAANELGTEPDRAAVFEDAIAGVEAGRAGHFAFVVGVDRNGEPDELRKAKADVVVSDLSELLGS